VRGIKGKVTASVSFTANTSSISFDMAESLVVDSVIFHQNKLLFTRPGNLTLRSVFPPCKIPALVIPSPYTMEVGRPVMDSAVLPTQNIIMFR
jgi:hypothetical protein